MNRIDRLTAIIIYLQGRRRVTVEELADRYDISNRTVYRDLRALQEAGVPIGSEPGEGFFIVRGYHLPPVMFDKEEAAALLTGERMMQKWGDTQLSESYLSALDKIRGVLHSREKEYLDTLDHHIRAFPYPSDRPDQTDPRVFAFLQDAIVDREVVGLTYFTPYRDQETQREIEPLGLLLRGGYWYLAGWCLLRSDYRMFRIDRIREYRKTAKRLPKPPEHTLKEFHDRSLRKEEDLQEMVVVFDREMIRYLGDQKYHYGWVSEQPVEDGVEMNFLTSSLEYFARWLLVWGSGVTVSRPEALQQRMRELSEEVYRHYQEISVETDLSGNGAE